MPAITAIAGYVQLGDRREHGGRALQPEVVERERDQPGEDRQVDDQQAVVAAGPRRRAHDRQCDRAPDQAEEEAQRQHVLELEVAADVAAEHRAERPQRSGGGRFDNRRRVPWPSGRAGAAG